MMLSKKDIQNIVEALRPLIAEEIEKALMIDVLVEKGPRKQGDPEKVVVHEKMPFKEWAGIYMPYIEAAMRGMQENVCLASNNVQRLNEKVQMVGKTMLGMHQSARKIARLSDALAQVEARNPSFLLGRCDHIYESWSPDGTTESSSRARCIKCGHIA